MFIQTLRNVNGFYFIFISGETKNFRQHGRIDTIHKCF